MMKPASCRECGIHPVTRTMAVRGVWEYWLTCSSLSKCKVHRRGYGKPSQEHCHTSLCATERAAVEEWNERFGGSNVKHPIGK